MLQVQPLPGGVTGVVVSGVDLGALPDSRAAEWQQLAEAFKTHGLILVQTAGSGDATPEEVQHFYKKQLEMKLEAQAGATLHPPPVWTQPGESWPEE